MDQDIKEMLSFLENLNSGFPEADAMARKLVGEINAILIDDTLDESEKSLKIFDASIRELEAIMGGGA